MLLHEKIQHLRLTEGLVRGLGRAMTKAEVVRAMKQELGQGVSHAYLCQLESGARLHMSPGIRDLLARFFKVHPGYLVSDPEEYQEVLVTGSFLQEVAHEDLSTWLGSGATSLAEDRLAAEVLARLAGRKDRHTYLLLLNRLLDAPDLAERLLAALHGSAPDRAKVEEGGGAASQGAGAQRASATRVTRAKGGRGREVDAGR